MAELIWVTKSESDTSLLKSQKNKNYLVLVEPLVLPGGTMTQLEKFSYAETFLERLKGYDLMPIKIE